MQRTSLNVFNYKEPDVFFRDLFSEIRRRRHSYSTRAWCKKIEISNSGTLSKILKGERPAPLGMTELLAKHHGLSEIELAYLQVLCVCKDKVSPATIETLRDALMKFET